MLIRIYASSANTTTSAWQRSTWPKSRIARQSAALPTGSGGCGRISRTSSTLAGTVAADYGFRVTETGIGTKVVNIGLNGTAFDVANGSSLTIMQLLLATNDQTDVPDCQFGFAYIYDRNGDGVIDAYEAQLRAMANAIYSWINDGGSF